MPTESLDHDYVWSPIWTSPLEPTAIIAQVLVPR
jgi:hypothetical protein